MIETVVPLTTGRICLYHGTGLDSRDRWTTEHVIPAAIGGDVIDGQLFERVDVCSYCNNLCGQWVDGPYIRSFMTNVQRAQTLWQSVDLSVKPIIPLIYMGLSTEVEIPDGCVCEVWHGPGGDQIFHIHQPYPREPHNPPIIGRPLNLPLEKIDRGITFVFVAATEPWWPTVLRTAARHFVGSELYLGNGASPASPYAPIPIHRQALFAEMKRYAWHLDKHTSFEVSPQYAERFEHKVALGVGACLLNPSFVSSTDAQRLRDILFCSDDMKRQELITEGSGLLEGIPELEPMMRWPGAHTLIVRPSPDNRGLVLIFQPYAETACLRVISRTPSHWQDRIPESGLIYVIAPGLRRHAGPIPFISFLAWKTDSNRFPNDDLDQLKSHMDNLPTIPSPVG